MTARKLSARPLRLDAEAGFLVPSCLVSVAEGFLDRSPAPRLAVDRPPGMAGQPQANLIWRMWLDHGGVNGDRSRAALERWLDRRFGFNGGLDGLTMADARAVIDDLGPLLWALREAVARAAAADEKVS